MILHSPDIQARTTIAPRFTCTGANATPRLNWSDVPHQARELALTLFDPDARGGAGYTHWVVYRISPQATSTEELDHSISGMSDAGPGYHGPCPPPGDKPHHYVFTLYALDTKLPPSKSMTYAELQDAMRGHVLETAELMGEYAR